MELDNLATILETVAKEKNVRQEILVEALEAAMLTAARRVFGMNRDLEAPYREQQQNIQVYEWRTVTAEVVNEDTEITVADGQKTLDPECEVGDVLGQLLAEFPPQKVSKNETPEESSLRRRSEAFGRVAFQAARQVFTQRVREAERENVFSEYGDRKEELVTGVVRRFERGNLIVDLGRAEAVLPLREQCPRESYRNGDRIQAYVLDVSKQVRGSQIVLSRTHPGLLMKLFEIEVPEIYEGIVKIEAAAREPGARSKIAVSSSDRDVDPVGACVGMKGSRVQAVVQELRGEKVDIVPFDEEHGALCL